MSEKKKRCCAEAEYKKSYLGMGNQRHEMKRWARCLKGATCEHEGYELCADHEAEYEAGSVVRIHHSVRRSANPGWEAKSIMKPILGYEKRYIIHNGEVVEVDPNKGKSYRKIWEEDATPDKKSLAQKVVKDSEAAVEKAREAFIDKCQELANAKAAFVREYGEEA